MQAGSRVAVVTGGARGVGHYIAGTLLDASWRVALADLDAERLTSAASEFQSAGKECLAVPTDIRDEASVQSLMASVHQRFGQIDVLVNNAAIVPHFMWGNPLWPRVRDQDKAFWDRVIDTNLGGAFLCSKHVLPYMEARGAGHIVNLHGGGASIGACAYGVTKDALRTFTRYLADEEREHGVCVVIAAITVAIATEDAPEEARQRMPGPSVLGNLFVLAAEAGMGLSGHLVGVKDGRLVAVD
jgi:NAD(P)-dependent dehydrogenase (short-subunit alcohol dehydrogenase family)